MQVDLGGQALGDAVDRRQRLGKLLVDVPLAAEALIVDVAGTGGQSPIAEIGQGRIVDLDDIDAGVRQRPRLCRQDLRQVVHEALERRIRGGAVVGVPVADGDQEGAGKGELGAAVGLADEELGIGLEHRFRRRILPTTTSVSLVSPWCWNLRTRSKPPTRARNSPT